MDGFWWGYLAGVATPFLLLLLVGLAFKLGLDKRWQRALLTRKD